MAQKKKIGQGERACPQRTKIHVCVGCGDGVVADNRERVDYEMSQKVLSEIV
jgi:hypothetical protein